MSFNFCYCTSSGMRVALFDQDALYVPFLKSFVPFSPPAIWAPELAGGKDVQGEKHPFGHPHCLFALIECGIPSSCSDVKNSGVSGLSGSSCAFKR